MITCEKCGKTIDSLLVNTFDYEGRDNDISVPILDAEKDAVVLEVDKNWTGYELDEEEQQDTICCPHCYQFPFKSKEIQVYEVVKVVCFKQNK